MMKKEDNNLILMLGGNIGDTESVFKKALHQIEMDIGMIHKTSSTYISEPWGYENQDRFLNQAVQIITKYLPAEVIEKTKKVENQFGKDKLIHNGPRIIDIDLMFYNDLIYKSIELTIPHPRLHLRNFNLVPLNEIIPTFKHPVLRQSISELKDQCEDTLNVSILN